MTLSGPPARGSEGYAVARDLNPTLVVVSGLNPLGRETRKHPPDQVRKLAASLERFGFVLPVLVDDRGRVVAGWGLVLAARKLSLAEVPAITVDDLGDADLRMLRLALNRIGEDSSWDTEALKLEFGDVLQISNEIDLTLSGFEMGEIDVVLGDALAEEDALPVVEANDPPRSMPGDLWRLGDHRVLCGDSLQVESYQRLLGDENAHMVFTDPPWNIEIEGNVSGLGATKHKDFAFACGEMTDEQFEGFLRSALGHAPLFSADGALSYVCMHWSQMGPMLKAGEAIYDRLVNLCIWSKTNAGMGGFYRSRHELIFVFKAGTAAHINNISLGRIGHHRSNVWEYPGQNSFNGTAKSKLSLHPTAKPVALVADAIKDASDRAGVVLDPFGGSGSTLIAAEKTGRRARLIEFEPRFVDATLKRWEADGVVSRKRSWSRPLPALTVSPRGPAWPTRTIPARSSKGRRSAKSKGGRGQ
jgi:DNA modification methylase